jgi:U3 small nucleolar RNA-associated protein 23
MIMEPMAEATEQVRNREEREKFRAGLKSKRRDQVGVKRKRDLVDEGGYEKDTSERDEDGGKHGAHKRRKRGPKEPNPLSLKKPKKRYPAEQAQGKSHEINGHGDTDKQPEQGLRKRRKRKHKSTPDEIPATDTIGGEMADEA